MKTNKILFTALVATLMLPAAGCYERFEVPDPPRRYTDADFRRGDYTIITVGELKELFTTGKGSLTNYAGGTTSSRDPLNSATENFYYPITERVVVKGRVVSTDRYGNIYNSLFIQDGDAGIEIKTGVDGGATRFPIRDTVWVVCDGLVIGNYRSALSLGLKPESGDKSSDGKYYYANRGMGPAIVADRILLGPEGSKSDDMALRVPSGVSDKWLYDHTSMLLRFEGMESDWDGTYPQFMYKKGDNTLLPNVSFVKAIREWKVYRDAQAEGKELPRPTPPEPVNYYIDKANPQPSWGFRKYQDLNPTDKNDVEAPRTHSNYGSAKFNFAEYRGEASFLVRTSGYARFALDPVTPDGEWVDVTGIMSRYVLGRTVLFQITVNNVTDITPATK